MINAIYKLLIFLNYKNTSKQKKDINLNGRKLLLLNNLNKTEYQAVKVILKCSLALYIDLFIKEDFYEIINRKSKENIQLDTNKTKQ